jgi:hypothetical protein
MSNTKYVTTDENGFSTGFYDKKIHGDLIPSEAVSISDKNYLLLVHGQYEKALVDGNVVSKDRLIPFDAEKSISNIRNAKINEAINIGGVEIYADDKTQSRIMAARIKATENSDYTINWKTNSGFVLLDADTVIAIADAVHDHVQACFSAEAAIALEDFSDYQSLKDQFDLEYSQL